MPDPLAARTRTWRTAGLTWSATPASSSDIVRRTLMPGRLTISRRGSGIPAPVRAPRPGSIPRRGLHGEAELPVARGGRGRGEVDEALGVRGDPPGDRTVRGAEGELSGLRDGHVHRERLLLPLPLHSVRLEGVPPAA